MSGQSTGFGKLEGAVLSAQDGTIQGWAWNRLSPAQTLEVEVYAGGVLLGTALANLRDPRQPLPVEGAHGFKLTVVAKVSMLAAPYQIRARVRGTQVDLDGVISVDTEDEHRQKLLVYDGEVTGISGGCVTGWAVRRGHLGEPIVVEIYANGERLGSAPADRPEPVAPNWGGGRGFRLPLPPALLDGTVHNVSLRVAGTHFELAGSPTPIAVLMAPTLFARLEKVELELRSGLESLRAAESRAANASAQLAGELARRFDALLVLQRHAMERELSVLRSRLGVDDPGPQAGVKAPLSVHVVMDERISGFGWHAVERQNGLSFRWMAENAALVVDFSSPRGARLMFLVPHLLDEVHRDKLHILVNGEETSSPEWTRKDDIWQCEAMVPASVFRGRAFAVVNLIAPFARQPNNGDQRHLSIAVADVQLEAREPQKLGSSTTV